MGKAKGKLWRECGLITCLPDRMTGSTDPDVVDWLVPKHWRRMKFSNVHSSQFQATGEGTEDHVQFAALIKKALDQRLAKAGASPIHDASSGSAVVKEEKKTPTELLEDRVEGFLANIKATIRRHQDEELDMDSIQTKANADTQNAYTEPFKADLAKLKKTHKRLVPTLARMHKEKPNESEVPKVIKASDSCTEEANRLKGWAVSYGYFDEAGKRGKKRKGKGEE